MEYRMFTRIGIIIFGLAIITGPLYTVENYHFLSDTISELGAQNTRNNFIAIIGFISFGLGIVIDWIRHPSTFRIPFLLFGAGMLLAGIFPHKPIDPTTDFSATVDSLHSLLATLSGIAITVGFLQFTLFPPPKAPRLLSGYMASLCFFVPIAMFSFPEYAGILQRCMYAHVFVWLWFFSAQDFPYNSKSAS